MCMCNEYFWCLVWHMLGWCADSPCICGGGEGVFCMCSIYASCMVCGVYYVLGFMACVMYVIGVWHVCCISYVHIVCGEIWDVCTRGHVNACKVGVHVRYLCVCEICAHVMCVCVMYIMWWACVLSGRGWMVGVQGEYAMWCVCDGYGWRLCSVCVCVCVLLHVHT